MGPAWFWPGQPRIAVMIERLGLHRFDQFATGDLSFEDAHGQVQRGRGFSSMEGSWRLEGGLGTLIQALSGRLDGPRTHLDARVTALEINDAGCRASLDTGAALEGDRIVLAVPPRLAAEVSFTPALPADAMQALRAVPTWMAGQAKAVAVYDRPFWRDDGLSGDAMSRVGPLVEIHDASARSGGPYALFGFVGTAPDARRDERVLKQQVLAQLGRLFGPQAAHPSALFVKDWAGDPLTATPADLVPLYAHPRYGLPAALEGLYDGKVLFAGSEVARQFGGYLEGALEAAEFLLERLRASHQV